MKPYYRDDLVTLHHGTAVSVAAIGARLAGRPIDLNLPMSHVEAIAKVRWAA